MFTEQCIVEKVDNGTRAVIKANKDVPSDSLQSPSDPDAGYCGHKGKGYQMQVMETYSEGKSQPDLITHIKVEAANESDANALLPAIANATTRELAPTELLADTLGTTVYFDKSACDKCHRQSECPVKRDKKSCTMSYDAKSLRLSRRRKREKEEAFREKYRYRSGIEGTMSDLDRMTGLKHLRVRGMPQVRLAATLKATGLNILRSAAFKKRLKRRKKGQTLRKADFWALSKSSFVMCMAIFRAWSLALQ